MAADARRSVTGRRFATSFISGQHVKSWFRVKERPPSRAAALGAALGVLLLASAVTAQSPAAAPPDGDWALAFSDEFCCTGKNVPAKVGAGPFSDGGVDQSVWTFDLGNNNGWGNGEPEDYTSSRSNAAITTDSTGRYCVLAINAIDQGGGKYTSARINSKNHPVAGQVIYPPGGKVRVEARMHLPVGTASGTWPAFWMLAAGTTYGLTWPTNGEIDIMEAVKTQNQTFHTVHMGATVAPQYITFNNSCPGGPCNADWHTWSMTWSEGLITWELDGVQFASVAAANWAPLSTIATDPNAPFDQAFYMLLNLAAGDNYFSGQPSSNFGTQTFQIDFVRLYYSPAAAVTGGPVNNTCPYEVTHVNSTTSASAALRALWFGAALAAASAAALL